MSGWRLVNHDPFARPLGCNKKYGSSGYKKHLRAGTPACEKCLISRRHYQAELRRGQNLPRFIHPCGTRPAAIRHHRRGEPLDYACRVAEAKHYADLRAAQKRAASSMKGAK